MGHTRIFTYITLCYKIAIAKVFIIISGKSLDDLSHYSSRLIYKRPNFVF